ncbi:MAG: flagellar basal body rod protein FlgB [Clostridiales bacterium]|nr:flagellar basal body rod protein FlgB [Clostridiales bacterium]
MISTNAFDYINIMDKALDASWLRETALTNNIANMDTPFYKRQDVEFESVLKKELGRSKFESLDEKVSRLNGNARKFGKLSVSPYTDSVNYSYRLDKNNVDPDTEPMELASEQLRYELLTKSVTDEFTRMQTVLK